MTPMLKKILIIEDDPDILAILDYILCAEGYEVVLSADGKACANLLEILPDVVLMDVRLKQPGQNGDRICLRLKSDAQTRCFPVVLLSAENDLAAISKTCGADGFLAKPFDIAALQQKVVDIISFNGTS